MSVGRGIIPDLGLVRAAKPHTPVPYCPSTGIKVRGGHKPGFPREGTAGVKLTLCGKTFERWSMAGTLWTRPQSYRYLGGSSNITD